MTEHNPETAASGIAARTVRGTGWVIAWRLVSRNLGLVSTLLLVRLLEPSDFGLIALASGFINAVDALSSIGVHDALVRDPSPDRNLFDTGFGLAVLRSVLTAAIVAGLAEPAALFFQEPRLTVVMLALAVGVLLTGFENIGIVEFRRELSFRQEFDLQVWSRVLGVVTTIATAMLWHSYWALVAGILASRIVRLGLSYLICRYRPRITLRSWRRIIGFSFWTWCLTLLQQIRDRSDNVIIGRLLGAEQVGVFSVGAEVGSLPVTELVEPLNRALYSGFAALHGAGDGAGRLFLGSVGLAFLVVLPAGVGISLVADPLVHLTLGSRWVTAIPVVRIMGFVGAISVFSNIGGMLLNAQGTPKTTFLLSGIAAAIRIPMVTIFLMKWDLTGAAAGLGVSMLLEQALFLNAALPRAGLRFAPIVARAWRPIVACGIMIGAMDLMGMAWSTGSINTVQAMVADLALRSFTGAVIYVAAIVALWAAARYPDGAEAFLWDKATRLLRRANRWYGA